MQSGTTTAAHSETALLERLKQLVHRAIDEKDQQLVDMDRVTAETELASLPLDSLATVELLYEIEQTFDIVVPEEKSFDFQTVGDVITYIQEQLASKAR